MTKVMTIRPPEELKQALTDMAKKQGLTINALVIQILWEYVKEKHMTEREEI